MLKLLLNSNFKFIINDGITRLLLAYKAVLVLVVISSIHCNSPSDQLKSIYHALEPDYTKVKIQPSLDTLSFHLNDSTTNQIRCINFFKASGMDYISFLDKVSQTINIYEFQSRKLFKQIQLSQWFNGRHLYKISVYVKSFDSIFITNSNRLYMADSSGHNERITKFLDDPPLSWATLENITPPVFVGSNLYCGVRPYVNDVSLKALRKWKTIYNFNIKTKTATLVNPLPELYRHNLFGYQFLQFSYCYNDSGHFVLSYPAEIYVYETNLRDISNKYYAKSLYQKDTISSPAKEELTNDDTKGLKTFMIRDSYGNIYFDPIARRYLRVCYSKMSESDYAQKRRTRQQRMIIFDEKFRIIGENLLDDSIMLSCVLFGPDGNVYARVNPADEYGLHFVRLDYSDRGKDKQQLAYTH